MYVTMLGPASSTRMTSTSVRRACFSSWTRAAKRRPRVAQTNDYQFPADGTTGSGVDAGEVAACIARETSTADEDLHSYRRAPVDDSDHSIFDQDSPRLCARPNDANEERQPQGYNGEVSSAPLENGQGSTSSLPFTLPATPSVGSTADPRRAFWRNSVQTAPAGPTISLPAPNNLPMKRHKQVSPLFTIQSQDHQVFDQNGQPRQAGPDLPVDFEDPFYSTKPVSYCTLGGAAWVGHRALPFLLERLSKHGPFDEVSWQKVLNRAFMILDSFTARDTILLLNVLLPSSSFMLGCRNVEQVETMFARNLEGSTAWTTPTSQGGQQMVGDAAEPRRRDQGAAATDLQFLPRLRARVQKLARPETRTAKLCGSSDQLIAKLLFVHLEKCVLPAAFLNGRELPQMYYEDKAVAPVGETNSRSTRKPPRNSVDLHDDVLARARVLDAQRRRMRDLVGIVEGVEVFCFLHKRRKAVFQQRGASSRNLYAHLDDYPGDAIAKDETDERFEALAFQLQKAVLLHRHSLDPTQRSFLLRPGGLFLVAEVGSSLSSAAFLTRKWQNFETTMRLFEAVFLAGGKNRARNATTTGCTSEMGRALSSTQNPVQGRTAEEVAQLLNCCASFVEWSFASCDVCLPNHHNLQTLVQRCLNSVDFSKIGIHLADFPASSGILDTDSSCSPTLLSPLAKSINALSRLFLAASNDGREQTELAATILTMHASPLLDRLADTVESLTSRSRTTPTENLKRAVNTKTLATLFRGARIFLGGTSGKPPERPRCAELSGSASPSEQDKDVIDTIVTARRTPREAGAQRLRVQKALLQCLHACDLRYQKNQLAVIWEAASKLFGMDETLGNRVGREQLHLRGCSVFNSNSETRAQGEQMPDNEPDIVQALKSLC
ncbi:unnamed protein product [Amoebophrya sp. A120]|nr:unnamed protein product [Amoebophrya sp. A120]|eukprot:GSA120T00007996001.1